MNGQISHITIDNPFSANTSSAQKTRRSMRIQIDLADSKSTILQRLPYIFGTADNAGKRSIFPRTLWKLIQYEPPSTPNGPVWRTSSEAAKGARDDPKGPQTGRIPVAACSRIRIIPALVIHHSVIQRSATRQSESCHVLRFGASSLLRARCAWSLA